ncbi:hypothetical protein IAT38_001496 [Cryptococcus sp. DSM 104549]
MLFALICRWACNVCSYLYPAYASYKALSLHPDTSLEAAAQVERWLMYWAVVGTWTAVEAVIGWTFTWLPFYSLIKTCFFLYLSLPQSEGSTYIYHTHLAPLFREHERDIDIFLASLRTRAGSALAGGVGWCWEKAKQQLNIATPADAQAAAMLAQGQGIEGYPVQGVHQPPSLADPASGAMQTMFSFMSRYAGQYMPVAITAISAATANARGAAPAHLQATRSVSDSGSQSSRASQVPEQMSMPVPVPTPGVHTPGQGSDPSIRLRTFLHASANNGQGQQQGQQQGQGQYPPNLTPTQYAALTSARPPPQFASTAHLTQPGANRSVSSPAGLSPHGSDDSIGSASGGSARWDSYEQIRKEEVAGMQAGGGNGGSPGRPGSAGRKGSWFGWGAGAAGTPEGRDKSE